MRLLTQQSPTSVLHRLSQPSRVQRPRHATPASPTSVSDRSRRSRQVSDRRTYGVVEQGGARQRRIVRQAVVMLVCVCVSVCTCICVCVCACKHAHRLHATQWQRLGRTRQPSSVTPHISNTSSLSSASGIRLRRPWVPKALQARSSTCNRVRTASAGAPASPTCGRRWWLQWWWCSAVHGS